MKTQNEHAFPFFRIFDTLLLLVFALPVCMRYPILPSLTTPYILFGAIFFISVSYLWYSVRAYGSKAYERGKTIFTIVLLVLLLLNPIVTAIIVRSQIAKNMSHGTHDVILQLEAAIRYLNKGKNPYSETYFGTPMESWFYAENNVPTVNPALYHFVMPPFYLFFSYPFYAVSKIFFGFFDGRVPLVFSTIGVIILSFRLFRLPFFGRIAATLLTLNPLTLDYLIEGRSDMIVLFFLMLAVFLLQKKKYITSAMALAFALTTKQSSLLMFPVICLYLWFSRREKLAGYVAVVIAVVLAICLPFLLWNPQAFMGSTIGYISGTVSHSYPVSGYGFGMVLVGYGIIKDIHAFYPFFILEAAISFPILILLIKWAKRQQSYAVIWFSYALWLFFFSYFSRFFNNNHLGYIINLVILGSISYSERTAIS
jgi:hypothetical protein